MINENITLLKLRHEITIAILIKHLYAESFVTRKGIYFDILSGLLVIN